MWFQSHVKYKSLNGISTEPLTVEEWFDISRKIKPFVRRLTRYTHNNEIVMVVDLELIDGSCYRLKGSQLKDIVSYMEKFTLDEFKQQMILFEL